MKIETTNTYKNGLLINSEKRCTLKEFCKIGRFKAGQNILIGEVGKDGTTFNTESFWIGDATPFHGPSTNDGGIGWNWNVPIMNKFVLEIHTYE